jgi:pimeloyl-ACP methyl ester carboxylesterase
LSADYRQVTDPVLLRHERAGAGAPALVFVHGFGCSRTDWAAQLAHFAGAHDCVACDLRGHGESPGRAEDCSIETYGADVVRLLEALDLPPAVLVGHSMGCRVVLQAALDVPERVAGLVLIDGSRIGTGDPASAEASAAQAVAATGYARFAQALFDGMFLPTSDPKLRAHIVKRAEAVPHAIGAALFARFVAWDARDMERALSAARQPLLVIQSTYLNSNRVRVPLAPGQSTPWFDLVRAHCPQARIEIVTGVGHFPQIEAAGRVNALIENFVAPL